MTNPDNLAVLMRVAENIVQRQNLAGHPRWDDGSWRDPVTELSAENERLRAAIRAHRHGHLNGNGRLAPPAINDALWAVLGDTDE